MVRLIRLTAIEAVARLKRRDLTPLELIDAAALRIATNELRADRPGGAERAYALASTVSKFAPSW